MSNNAANDRSNEETAETDIIIGRVVSISVPKKQLRIAPETSYPERFRILQELRLKTREGPEVSLAIDELKVTQKVVIASVAVKDPKELDSVRGATVVVRRSERYPLPEDEYYVDDLVGLVVKDKAGKVIGKLCEVWETPANDIYQVLGDGGREILLPAIEDVVLKVDIEGGVMIADISNLI